MRMDCLHDSDTGFLGAKGLLCILCVVSGFKPLESNPRPLRQQRRTRGEIELKAKHIYQKLRQNLGPEYTDSYLRHKA